jgi:hypothetical protein
MEPYGQSLHDFLSGDISAKVVVHRMMDTRVICLQVFSSENSDISPLEQTAINLCRDVLDVGAGAGCHSLALQELIESWQSMFLHRLLRSWQNEESRMSSTSCFRISSRTV